MQIQHKELHYYAATNLKPNGILFYDNVIQIKIYLFLLRKLKMTNDYNSTFPSIIYHSTFWFVFLNELLNIHKQYKTIL